MEERHTQPLKILVESSAESERESWRRANELSRSRAENGGGFYNRNRERRRSQNRSGLNRLSIEPNVGGRTDRTGVVRGRRCLGMRVGGLHRPYHTDQGNAKQADDPAQPAPICPDSKQGAPEWPRKPRQLVS
jgi:hypothetical protein